MDKETKILVAVSGGVDSVYMLHKLISDGYTNLGIAHFNHMIRQDAGDDANLVRSLAEKHDIVFHYMEHDIPLMAKKQKKSLELAARDARRHFFKTIMAMNNYEWLALGHHADDQAETLLLNLIRGAGVHGLAGMMMIDENQKIYRPLFSMTKREIYQEAEKSNLEWNEDYTNHVFGFANPWVRGHDRSWIRHVVMAHLEMCRPEVVNVLFDTAARFQELSDFFKQVTESWCKNDDFSIIDFRSQHKALQSEILGALWEKYNGSREGFNRKVVDEVLKWVNGNPQGNTKVYFGNGHLFLKKGRISFVKNKNDID